MKIGIDFSINSTALTIKTNDDKLQIFSFVPNYRPELSSFKIHRILSEYITVISYEKIQNTKDPIKDQSIKLKNADNLSTAIIENISPFIGDESVEIQIEGFSFGSKGNSFIDLVTYNTFLKVKLIQKWGHCISVISPKSLKKMYTGNGNASKCDMLRSYLKERNFDKEPLKEKLIEMNLDKEGEFNIPKPIDDIVDSIALSSINI